MKKVTNAKRRRRRATRTENQNPRGTIRLSWMTDDFQLTGEQLQFVLTKKVALGHVGGWGAHGKVRKRGVFVVFS